MKLSDLNEVNKLQRDRADAINRHEFFTKVKDPTVTIQGVSTFEVWPKICDTVTAVMRNRIEEIEHELGHYGVEVEPHFTKDADGWLKPTSPLAPLLTARGYNLIETGGGCRAWVRIMADGEHVVVTDTNGGCEPTETDWLIGRYPDEEWQDGYARSTQDRDDNDTFAEALAAVEANPHKTEAK